MKNYTITVNGISYEVSVAEGTGAPQVAPVAQAAPAPQVAPEAKAAPEPKAASAPTGSEGSVEIECPMPGKILSVKASVGQAINKGDVVAILEAMKMENNIQSTADGTIKKISVEKGTTVLEGDELVVIG